MIAHPGRAPQPGEAQNEQDAAEETLRNFMKKNTSKKRTRRRRTRFEENKKRERQSSAALLYGQPPRFVPTRASVDVVFAIGYNAKVCVRAAARGVTPFIARRTNRQMNGLDSLYSSGSRKAVRL